jgi:hypothetical protein
MMAMVVARLPLLCEFGSAPNNILAAAAEGRRHDADMVKNGRLFMPGRQRTLDSFCSLMAG